jgi:hypothetical protein
MRKDDAGAESVGLAAFGTALKLLLTVVSIVWSLLVCLECDLLRVVVVR